MGACQFPVLGLRKGRKGWSFLPLEFDSSVELGEGGAEVVSVSLALGSEGLVRGAVVICSAGGCW